MHGGHVVEREDRDDGAERAQHVAKRGSVRGWVDGRGQAAAEGEREGVL